MHRTAAPAGRLPRRWRIERLLRRRNSRQRSCHGCAIRRPSPVLRRRLAQIRGAQAVTHGRFASAVHQERTRAGSAARVRLLLSEFRRIVDLHGIIFRRVDLRASLGICGCRLRSGGLLRRAAGFVLLPSLAADAAFVLPEPPFFAVGFAAGRSSGLLTVTISVTRGVRERNATRFRRGGRRVEMNSG